MTRSVALRLTSLAVLVAACEGTSILGLGPEVIVGAGGSSAGGSRSGGGSAGSGSASSGGASGSGGDASAGAGGTSGAGGSAGHSGGTGGDATAGAGGLAGGGGYAGERLDDTVDATEYLFDGQDDRVTIPAAPAYDLGSGDFTFRVRASIDLSQAGSVVPLVSRRITERDGFLFIGYFGKLLLQMNGVPNFVTLNELPELSDGLQHTFGVTRKSGAIVFYVDGSAYDGYMDRDWTMPAVSTRSIDGTGPIVLGYEPAVSSAYAGRFREFDFWNRALDQSEFQTKPLKAGLVGRWVLSRAMDQYIPDSSPINNRAFLGSDEYRVDPREPRAVPTK